MPSPVTTATHSRAVVSIRPARDGPLCDRAGRRPLPPAALLRRAAALARPFDRGAMRYDDDTTRPSDRRAGVREALPAAAPRPSDFLGAVPRPDVALPVLGLDLLDEAPDLL